MKPARVSKRERTKPANATESFSPSKEISSFLIHLASERGLTHNTLLAYRQDLEDCDAHLRTLGKTLSTADADQFRDYLQSQSRIKQSTRTVARRLAAIRTFLRFLRGEGVETDHILQQLDRPKPQSSLPMIMGKAMVLQLINGVDPNSPLWARDVAILELLYASGLRASELCDLSLRDINLQVGVVRVLGKGMKERVVPVGRAALETITRYLQDCRPLLDKHHGERLFLSRTGRPLERVALWMLVKRIALQAGLPPHVHTHVLRHCFASHLLSGGADLRVVQELLGHADISTTQIYTHVDQSRLKAIHEKYHPRK